VKKVKANRCSGKRITLVENGKKKTRRGWKPCQTLKLKKNGDKKQMRGNGETDAEKPLTLLDEMRLGTKEAAPKLSSAPEMSQ